MVNLPCGAPQLLDDVAAAATPLLYFALCRRSCSADATAASCVHFAHFPSLCIKAGARLRRVPIVWASCSNSISRGNWKRRQHMRAIFCAFNKFCKGSLERWITKKGRAGSMSWRRSWWYFKNSIICYVIDAKLWMSDKLTKFVCQRWSGMVTCTYFVCLLLQQHIEGKLKTPVRRALGQIHDRRPSTHACYLLCI